MDSVIDHTCQLEELDALMGHHLKTLWAHPEDARIIPPLMVWGPPGIGKSDLVRQRCQREGIAFLDVRLAQREPVDLRGLPVPREDAVHWLLPAEWPRDPDSRGIILFDELTSADRTLQVAAYEFILDRRLGDLYAVPPGWYIMAAGNRIEDRAVATTMSSALANRFCHVEVRAELEPWVRWAMDAGVHPSVVGFLRFRPECLFSMKGNTERGWPSPRTWERVALELTHGPDLTEDMLRVLVTGLVGAAAGIEFMAYLLWTARIPDVPEMLAGREPVKIPERSDQRFALCASIVHHMWQAPDRDKMLLVFFDVGQQLTSDYAAMMMVDAVNYADVDRAQAILGHPRFDDWSKQHGAAFAARHSLHANRIAARVLDNASGDADSDG